MRSMTGFGRGTGESKTVEVVAEIKTVDLKYHDLSLKVPLSYQFLEPELRELILSSVTRGEVDFFLKDLWPARSRSVEVNETQLSQIPAGRPEGLEKA